MSAPLIQFVIGGVQKGGTTALAQLIARHPQIALPRDKEAHVFDAPDFAEHDTPAQIDARYAGHFAPAAEDVLHGDATPIYCFHPTFIQRIAAYNPQMRWILLLRHPVERAISHYHMERRRGLESWPLWLALLLERWRLRGHEQDFSIDSPLRRHSYRARGDYARQLDTLYAHFPPEQVLLLRTRALAQTPERTLAQIWSFLGVDPGMAAPAQHTRIFTGDYRPLPRRSLRFVLLTALMSRQLRRMRQRYGLDWVALDDT